MEEALCYKRSGYHRVTEESLHSGNTNVDAARYDEPPEAQGRSPGTVA